MNIESSGFRTGVSREAAYQAGVLQSFGLWRRSHVAVFPSIRAAMKWLSIQLKIPTSYCRGRAYIMFGCHADAERMSDAHGEYFAMADLKAAVASCLRKSMFDDGVIIWQRCRLNRIHAVLGSVMSPSCNPDVRAECKSIRQTETRYDWYKWIAKTAVKVIQASELDYAPTTVGGFSAYHFEVAPYGESTSREVRRDGSIDYQGLGAIFLAVLLTRSLSLNNVLVVMREVLKSLQMREYGSDDFGFDCQFFG